QQINTQSILMGVKHQFALHGQPLVLQQPVPLVGKDSLYESGFDRHSLHVCIENSRPKAATKGHEKERQSASGAGIMRAGVMPVTDSISAMMRRASSSLLTLISYTIIRSITTHVI